MTRHREHPFGNGGILSIYLPFIYFDPEATGRRTTSSFDCQSPGFNLKIIKINYLSFAITPTAKTEHIFISRGAGKERVERNVASSETVSSKTLQ